MPQSFFRNSLFALLIISASAQATETERQFLSGKGKDDGVAWDFMCTTGQNANKWSTIKVPSNWELQGFGTYTYGRDKFPNSNWPWVRGQYKKTFTAPATWSDKRIFLVFEGSMTDTEAQINGQSAGPIHQGGFYQFKYDVTGKVKIGAENLLEVTVDDESDNASVNRAERRGDFWNFAGIYRPVYLEAVPQQFIERVAIDAKADGTLNADIFAGGLAQADALEAQILDLQGQPVGASFSQPISAAPRASSDGATAHLQTKANAPRLWNAETPNLYQLEIRLKQGNAVIHSTRQKFGFRTIEVRKEGDDKGVFVNGQRILLKGTCRHSFWPDSGRCTSEQLSHDDVLLMKEMNMNAVRMTHYPPDAHFLDACDELGLYVLDEIAGWHAAYDNNVGHNLTREMVTRDVNHPCILFWDNGNEGGFNLQLDDDYAKYDIQKREVLHPWTLFRGIDTKHYPNYADLLQKASAPNVYFATEMLHGLYDGGAGASLDEYWKVIRASKVAAGGFIWAFVDEDVVRTDKGGKLDSDGNQAPDGIVGPYREREGSFYTIKELWSPIVLTRAGNGSITLENRYDFTDANKCTYNWEWCRFKRPNEPDSGYITLASAKGQLDASIAPGHAGKLKVPASLGNAAPAGAEALAVTVNDPSGKELWTWVWPEKGSSYLDLVKAPAAANARVTYTETPEFISVKTIDLTFSFHKFSGMMDTIARGTKSMQLYNGPRLVTGSGLLTNFSVKPDGNDVVITALFSGELKSFIYRIRPNGWVTLNYDYTLTGPHDFWGIGFDYPEGGVRSARFLGNGPYRVWKNRLAGGTLNVWDKMANTTFTGDPDDSNGKLDYPEFKGFYSDVRWMQLRTGDGLITLLMHQDGQYVQLLTPQFPSLQLQGKTAVNFPTTNIAVLGAIPPIGSKFVPASVTGPSSSQSRASGEYQGAISLFFGEIPK